MIVLNNRFDHKKHKVNALASKEEYDNALRNCR